MSGRVRCRIAEDHGCTDCETCVFEVASPPFDREEQWRLRYRAVAAGLRETRAELRGFRKVARQLSEECRPAAPVVAVPEAEDGREALWRATLDEAVIPARVRKAMALADAEIAAAMNRATICSECGHQRHGDTDCGCPGLAVPARDDERERLAALALIASWGCENFHEPLNADPTPCFRWGRMVGAAYGSERPCAPCVATRALAAAPLPEGQEG